MNRILIIGVAGFLGSNLAEHLLEDENNYVFGIDDFSSSDMTNLYVLLKNDRFNFIENDLSKEISCTCDYIYNFIGSGDKMAYLNDKYTFTYKLLNSTKKILEYAKSNGSTLLNITEQTSTNNIKKDYFLYYDVISLINSLVKEYSITCNVNSKIVRLYDVYGKNMLKSDKRIIPSTIIKAFNNQNIELDYDEQCYFTYSNDAIIALEKIMNSYTDEEIIDVSSLFSMYKSDVIKMIFNFTKSKSKLIIKNNDIFNQPYYPNLSYLNNNLNTRCLTPVLEGISKTIDYFKQIYFS